MTSSKFVDPHTLQGWLDEGSAVLVDVRESHEHQQAHIEGSVLLSLSVFDPASIPDLDPDHGGRRLVLHCAHGIRCGVAAEQLAAAGHPGTVWRLMGGIKAWFEAGLPILR